MNLFALLLRSLNCGNIEENGDEKIDTSTLIAFQNYPKPNVQSCLLIIFQYQPISLQYSWLSVEQPESGGRVLYMHHWEFPILKKTIPYNALLQSSIATYLTVLQGSSTTHPPDCCLRCRLSLSCCFFCFPLNAVFRGIDENLRSCNLRPQHLLAYCLTGYFSVNNIWNLTNLPLITTGTSLQTAMENLLWNWVYLSGVRMLLQ